MQAEGITLVFKSVSPSRAAVCECNGVIIAQRHQMNHVSGKINTKSIIRNSCKGEFGRILIRQNLTIALQTSTKFDNYLNEFNTHKRIIISWTKKLLGKTGGTSSSE